MFPPLAGRDAEYFAQEMNRYKSGDRQDPMMNTVAQPLSEAEIVALAEYYAEIPAE
jgi:cytochrome c553